MRKGEDEMWWIQNFCAEDDVTRPPDNWRKGLRVERKIQQADDQKVAGALNEIQWEQSQMKANWVD